MELYVGVDGGSTAARGAICDAEGNVVGSCTAAKVVHPLSPGGPRRLREILGAVGRALPADVRVAAVYLALTGVERPGDPAQRVALEVARELWPDAVVAVDTDGMAAWAGATGCKPGVAAMAGTGCVVIAVDEDGQRVRTGGWGPTLGDFAGGWGIGLSAVRQMLFRFDGGQPPSELDRDLLAALGVASPADVPGRVTSGRISRLRVVELAKTVASRAGQDASAGRILAGAASALARDVVAAIHRLNWSSLPVVVVPVGNVFQAGAAYLEPFERAVQEESRFPVRFDRPVLSNLGGAVLLALREAGLSPDDRIARLASSRTVQRRDQ
jgi:N-acetylglucosamine kinase-like BadF-type ATPase